MHNVNESLEQRIINCIEDKIEDQLQSSICEDVISYMNALEQESEERKIDIWKKIINKYDPGILKEKLKLEYVLQSKMGVEEEQYKGKKVLIVAHMFYTDLFEVCIDYLCRVPEQMRKFITTSDYEKKEKIEEWCNKKGLRNFQIMVVENRGREMSALLVECRNLVKEYDFLCFVHDKATSGEMGAPKIGSTFMHLLWDNLLKSSIYIRNVLNFLESHPYLGVLVPPAPYHSQYFGNYGAEWTGCFGETEKLANKLNLTCKMSKDIPPYTLGTAFWCRVEALNALWKYHWEYEDFPQEPLSIDNSVNHAIERIFAYVAQHEGYATGIVMNEEYASVQLSNYNYILNGLVKKKRQTMSFLKYKDYIDKDFFYDFGNLRYYALNYKKIFIYGTGFFSKEITEYLNEYHISVEGYVVSDGHRQKEKIQNCPVYEISEIIDYSDTLLVVALKREDFEDVLPVIQEKGFENIYYNGEQIKIRK